jgi:N-methylhydantoinase B
MDQIELSLFASRINAISEEMGAVLQQAAFSPNIRDRLDYSCAVFDVDGELCAQAAHIPVHLGSMAYAMKDIIGAFDWAPGDMVIVNDPYLGGTHLPDVTVVASVFVENELVAFVANRAHHADIGSESPGSMPISTTLEEEGLLIPPTRIMTRNKINHDLFESILAQTSNRSETSGDFNAQISANRVGAKRLLELIQQTGVRAFADGLHQLNDYADKLALSAIKKIPTGRYEFTDVMDDDGLGQRDIRLSVTLDVHDNHVEVDFSGSSEQVAGNINCPLSVTAAATYYVFRCLMPEHTPAVAGSFRRIHLHATPGSVLNANRPAAVAAGNVETSTRIVDVLLGALYQAIPERIPAASHGSMNNLAMGARANQAAGSKDWNYYETIGGGMGGGESTFGLSAVQTHMTNTLNTPIEVLESHYPLRVTRYQIRVNSGGAGKHKGGDGIIREFEFLRPARVTLLTERRLHKPWGLNGGADGLAGKNLLNDKELPPKATLTVAAGDHLTIQTPGGGGYGKAD